MLFKENATSKARQSSLLPLLNTSRQTSLETKAGVDHLNERQNDRDMDDFKFC